MGKGDGCKAGVAKRNADGCPGEGCALEPFLASVWVWVMLLLIAYCAQVQLYCLLPVMSSS